MQRRIPRINNIISSVVNISKTRGQAIASSEGTVVCAVWRKDSSDNEDNVTYSLLCTIQRRCVCTMCTLCEFTCCTTAALLCLRSQHRVTSSHVATWNPSRRVSFQRFHGRGASVGEVKPLQSGKRHQAPVCLLLSRTEIGTERQLNSSTVRWKQSPWGGREHLRDVCQRAEDWTHVTTVLKFAGPQRWPNRSSCFWCLGCSAATRKATRLTRRCQGAAILESACKCIVSVGQQSCKTSAQPKHWNYWNMSRTIRMAQDS